MSIYKQIENCAAKYGKELAAFGGRAEVAEAVIAVAHSLKKMNDVEVKTIFTTLVPDVARVARSSKARIALESLQKAYESRVRGETKFKNAIDWLLNSKSKHVDELATLLTGLKRSELREIIYLSERRILQIDCVVRNSYLPKVSESFLRCVKKSPERLAKLFEDYQEVIEEFRKTGRIRETDFWKIKGTVTEMLSIVIKEAHLAEISKKYPKAEIIENVMARTQLTRAGEIRRADAPRQIWDGIIAEVSDGELNILFKFEVKSGMQGFREGFEQVLATQYNRFTSFGDELIITTKSGVRKIFKGNAIKGAKSENVLITPKGQSSMMPNQLVQEGDFSIKTLLLEVGGREIDHFDIEALTMDLLMSDLVK